MREYPKYGIVSRYFVYKLAPWPLATRGAFAGLVAAGGPVLSWSWEELLRTRHDRRLGEARTAVAEERARIARELHDVVAHNVSLIVVQAVAADDVFDTRPELSREALRSIETSGGPHRRSYDGCRARFGPTRTPMGMTPSLGSSARDAGRVDPRGRARGRPAA